jgi:hypothetical protein
LKSTKVLRWILETITPSQLHKTDPILYPLETRIQTLLALEFALHSTTMFVRVVVELLVKSVTGYFYPMMKKPRYGNV